MPLALPKFGYDIRVHACDSSEIDRGTAINKNTVQWLKDAVGIGDVIYDLDAGVGLFSVIASKYPRCGGRRLRARIRRVQPIYATTCASTAAMDRSCPAAGAVRLRGIGRAEISPEGRAGQARHSLRPTAWRVGRVPGTRATSSRRSV